MMRDASKVPVLLFVTLLLSASMAPSATAAHLQAPILDEQLGTLTDRLEQARATYGPRPEWNATHTQLGLTATALLQNATVIAATELGKATAALETGRARAIAQGLADPDEAIREHADRLAHTARGDLARVHASIDNTTDRGLGPGGLDDGLLVAYAALLAEDQLAVYERARTAWSAGERTERAERSLVGGAAGAASWADMAASMWAARANGSDQDPELDRVALNQLAHERAAHARDHATILTSQSQERVDRLAREGRPVLAMAAFLLWAQDATFNEQRLDETGEGRAERLLAEEGPRVEAWIEALGVEGDLAGGALESARVALAGEPSTGGRAFAASLVVVAVEHVGVLVDGFGGVDRTLGTSLPGVPEQDGGAGFWIVAIAVLVAVAVATVWLARRRWET